MVQRGRILKGGDFKRMNVDMTIEEKNTTFPTDTELLCKGIELAVRHSRRGGYSFQSRVSSRQSLGTCAL